MVFSANAGAANRRFGGGWRGWRGRRRVQEVSGRKREMEGDEDEERLRLKGKTFRIGGSEKAKTRCDFF
ncbi:hypothetical protein FF1_003770 [Malus domestica]